MQNVDKSYKKSGVSAKGAENIVTDESVCSDRSSRIAGFTILQTRIALNAKYQRGRVVSFVLIYLGLVAAFYVNMNTEVGELPSLIPGGILVAGICSQLVWAYLKRKTAG